MSDQQELLLQLLDDTRSEEMAPVFMEHVLNRGLELLPHVVQTGAKNGQTLKAHIQNVICFAYHLATILNVNDSDKTNLLGACYVHDLNKHPEFEGKTYDAISNKENVSAILEQMLAESDQEYDISVDLIVEIIRAHSGHYHVDGNGLLAATEEAPYREKLIAIIRAADLLDLSHNFHETDQKIKALRYINSQVEDFQYEYTWHYFSDNRGIYTNLIQNAIVDLYEKMGAKPLLYYPQGVWYLINKGDAIHITPYQIACHFQKMFDGMSMENPSKSLRYAKIGYKFGQNPFHLKISPSEIINLLVKEIIEKRTEKTLAKKFDEMNAKSAEAAFKRFNKWMQEADKISADLEKAFQNFQKILEKFNLEMDFDKSDTIFNNLQETQKKRVTNAKQKYLKLQHDSELAEKFTMQPLWTSPPEGLFKPDADCMRCGDLVGSFTLLLINQLDFDSDDAWALSAQIAGLPKDICDELTFFDKQSDRALRTATLLYENGSGFNSVQQAYTQYLENFNQNDNMHFAPAEDLVEYLSENLRTPQNEIKRNVSALRKYIESNHQQCSHCGGATGLECEAPKVPDGIKTQLFSNRLIGGHTSKVKRNVCKICFDSLLAEKLVAETYDNRYYLHLFADGGEFSSHAEPSIFLEALKKGLMNLERIDCRTLLIQPNQLLSDFFNDKPLRLHGLAKKKWGLIVPKFSQSIGGQITMGINPPGGKTTNNSTRFVFALFHLLIIVNRYNLRGILSKSSIPPLKADEFHRIFIDHIPLSFQDLIPSSDLDYSDSGRLWADFTSLFGLRNTYNLMDEKEIIKIAKTLYDKSGLELFHHLKKSYSKEEKTKEFAPWKRAWPYLRRFIQEEYLMPIRKMAEVALKNHFHGKSFKETSQAKPLDLAFDAMAKHHPPETENDLKMVILHDVTRGLERLSPNKKLGKSRSDAARDFVDVFFEELFHNRYKSEKNKMIRDQRRIRAAFIGYLNVLRDEFKQIENENEVKK